MSVKDPSIIEKEPAAHFSLIQDEGDENRKRFHMEY
jgi:hypothetical protein